MAKLDSAKVVVIGDASGVGYAVAQEEGAEVVGSNQTPRIGQVVRVDGGGSLV